MNVAVARFGDQTKLIEELLGVFSLSDRMPWLVEPYSPAQRKQRFAVVKEEAKREFRRLAKECHPDFAKNAEDFESKSEDFRSLKLVYDTLQGIELVPLRVKCHHCNGSGYLAV